MDDTELVVKIDYSIYELPEDNSSFVLLQKAVLFGVLEEIAFSHNFSDQEKTRLSFELT